MKASQAIFVLVGLVSFISPAIGAPVANDGIKTETVIARDDDSRDITPEEQAQIGQVLRNRSGGYPNFVSYKIRRFRY
ncbi:MAG: hypothetical protein ACK5CA_08765 [Cyanobacteriota bacterium]|jgi:hypothetical protein